MRLNLRQPCAPLRPPGTGDDGDDGPRSGPRAPKFALLWRRGELARGNVRQPGVGRGGVGARLGLSFAVGASGGRDGLATRAGRGFSAIAAVRPLGKLLPPGRLVAVAAGSAANIYRFRTERAF